MRFERESYRKLYIVESPEHQLLPLIVRGVRDYLLRFASEDGTLLADSKDPVGDLGVVLRARPKERKFIELTFAELKRVGYLRVDRGRVWLPRFVEAQAARSPGAIRQQRMRDKKRNGGDDGNGTGDDTADATGSVSRNASGDARDTLPTTDETRRDETTTKPVVAGAVACPKDLKLTPDQRGTLETSLVPGWAIDQITTDFVANYQADPDDKRELPVWRKCLSRAVSGTWNNNARRPKKPEAASSVTVWDTEAGKVVQP